MGSKEKRNRLLKLIMKTWRQIQAGRPSNYSAADNSILRRSASYNFYNEEIPKPAEREPRLADFKKKSKSVKENVNLWTEAETSKSKGVGWRMLKPMVALNGGCKASTNSVIQCSTKKFSHDSLAEPTKTSNRSLNVSLYADQNSLNTDLCDRHNLHHFTINFKQNADINNPATNGSVSQRTNEQNKEQTDDFSLRLLRLNSTLPTV